MFLLKLTLVHLLSAQACILGSTPRKQQSFPVNPHLLQLGFLSGSSFHIARLLEEQFLNMWVLQG
jgi:hypothetical protein